MRGVSAQGRNRKRRKPRSRYRLQARIRHARAGNQPEPSARSHLAASLDRMGIPHEDTLPRQDHEGFPRRGGVGGQVIRWYTLNRSIVRRYLIGLLQTIGCGKRIWLDCAAVEALCSFPRKPATVSLGAGTTIWKRTTPR